MRAFLFRRCAVLAALSLIVASCGGGARGVAVQQHEEGYYTEVQDIDPKFLCAAAENGDLREARFLLENGADTDALCHTAGLYTKAGCSVFAIGLMITAPLAGKCWEPREPPMTLAAGAGHAEIVKLLLEYGAKPNATYRAHFAKLRRSFRYTGERGLLHWAAASGRREILNSLLTSGAQLDQFLLITAIQGGNHEIVQLLLDCGVNPGAGDIKGVHNAWDYARDNPVMRGILNRWLKEAEAGIWEKNCPQKKEA